MPASKDRQDRDNAGAANRVKIGIDLSIVDRVETGTAVYAKNLFASLKALPQDEFLFIPLRSPRPLPRRNILTKFGNLFLELFWLTVLLPVRCRQLGVSLVHMPANTISPTLRIPQVCTIHDAHFISNPAGRDRLWMKYAGWSFRYAATHATRIISDTNSGKLQVVRLLGANPENIVVISLGLPARNATRADKDIAAGLGPYILTVGATDPNKNIVSLLEAYQSLLLAGHAAGHKLVIAGPPGSDHQVLTEAIRRNKLESDVKLLGKVSDSFLAALYEHASLFVFPSLCEGFGFPPLEAMQYGVPVIASDAPCIPETLGDAPLYFNPHDITEISDKIHRALSDSQLRERLQQAGPQRASLFTWENTASQTMDVYRTVLAAS